MAARISTMNTRIQASDLGFFNSLAVAGSLSAAARELGISTPAVSKHLAVMEARVGLPLVNRSTRRMSLTPEGELVLEHARRILGEIDEMQNLLGLVAGEEFGQLFITDTHQGRAEEVFKMFDKEVKSYHFH